MQVIGAWGLLIAPLAVRLAGAALEAAAAALIRTTSPSGTRAISWIGPRGPRWLRWNTSAEPIAPPSSAMPRIQSMPDDRTIAFAKQADPIDR